MTHVVGMDAIADVHVTLSALLGRAHASIREVMEFRVGSIIPLHIPADATVPLLVNGVAVARGEIVTLENGCLAIEIADISLPPDFDGCA